MSLKIRGILATLAFFTVVSIFAMVFGTYFWPLMQPMAKVQRAVTRVYPRAHPHLSLLAGEKSGDQGMIQLEVTATFNPEEKTADARVMAVRSAQFAKMYYPLEGFSHIRVVVKGPKKSRARTFTFSSTATASTSPVLAAPLPHLPTSLEARHAGTDIR